MKYIIIVSIFIIPNILFSQWVISNSGTTEILETVYFINTTTGYAGGDNGLMIKTTNNGQSWSNLTTGITDNINSVYFFNSSSGIACGNSGKIIITTNSGSSWSEVPSGVTDNLLAVSFFNNRGVCSGTSGTLLFSTNSGLNWTIAENGFFVVYYGINMVSETVAYACGVNTIFQPFVAKTINGGANWTFTNFYLNGNEGNLSDINFISENEGFASSRVFDGQGGISYTSDGGVNWTTQLFPTQLNAIDFIGINIGYSAGENGLILKTTNQGATWISQPNPASITFRSIDFVDSANGFAVGDNGIIVKTTNGGISAINHSNEITPDKFSLSQNYPNPFNPNTIINYELKISNYITLKVYDALGKELTTLVDAKQNAGNYSVIFDGTNFPGGVYFYTLESSGYSETKRFVLLK